MKTKAYNQDVLIGKRKKRAILRTLKDENGSTYSILLEGKSIASRSTTSKRNDEETIQSLSKAVNGLTYIFLIPVSTKKETIKERYFQINN